jgi:hypothetical protein
MSYGEIISLGAVVVAIVALAYQIWQNTKQLRLQNFATFTQRYDQIMLRLPVWSLRQCSSLSYLGETEREDVLRLVASYFDLCAAEHHVRKQKLIPTSVWNHWQESMVMFLRQPIQREAWEVMQHERYHTSGFLGFLEAIKARAADGSKES